MKNSKMQTNSMTRFREIDVGKMSQANWGWSNNRRKWGILRNQKEQREHRRWCWGHNKLGRQRKKWRRRIFNSRYGIDGYRTDGQR